MNNRVFVTGMSAVSACGMDLKQTWDAIDSGQSGIAPVEQLEHWEYRLGGELKAYQPRNMLPDKKLLKVISRQDVIGINAACQAVDDSGMIAFRDELPCVEHFNERTGVYVASPGNKYCQQYDFLPLLAQSQGEMTAFSEKLFESVHPMWLLRILPNNVLAYTGIHYGFKGPNHNIANHAVSSLQALNEAIYAIEQGLIDRAVVVAYDLGIEPQGLMNYAMLGVLSNTGLKPFDANHDGTVLAEGGAALVLESEQSVKERHAKPIVEVLPGLSMTEQGGVFGIEKNAQTLIKLLEQSLAKHQLNASDISLITAHGNGNPHSDNTEAMAYATVFPHDPLVTAYKWALGHTLAASGLMDAVLTALSMQRKKVPAIASSFKAAPECSRLNLAFESQSISKPVSVLVNRGFGAMAASTVMQACD